MRYKPRPHLYLVAIGVGFSLFSIRQLLSLNFIIADQFAVTIAILAGTLLSLAAFEHIKKTTKIPRF